MVDTGESSGDESRAFKKKLVDTVSGDGTLNGTALPTLGGVGFDGYLPYPLTLA